MIILSSKDTKNLIDKSTNNIDFLLKRFKELDGLTNDVYEALGVLDDLIIEFEDLHRNYLYQRKAYDKLRLNKSIAITEQINYNQRKGGI